MVTQSYSHLCEKVAANEVDGMVMQKLSMLAFELNNRNYVAANAIQTVI